MVDDFLFSYPQDPDHPEGVSGRKTPGVDLAIIQGLQSPLLCVVSRHPDVIPSRHGSKTMCRPSTLLPPISLTWEKTTLFLRVSCGTAGCEMLCLEPFFFVIALLPRAHLSWSPGVQPDDGYIVAVAVKSNVSRLDVIGMAMNMKKVSSRPDHWLMTAA